MTIVGDDAHEQSVHSWSEEQEAKAISRLVDRMVGRFPQVPPDQVDEIVRAAHQAFLGARIRQFVPVLVEHDVLVVLRDLTRRVDSARHDRGPAGRDVEPVT